MASPPWRPALILVDVSVHVCPSACLFLCERVECVSVCVCVCVCVCVSVCSPLSVYLGFACVFASVHMEQDVIYHSQIYNSGTQRGMNTLVSVADEGDEQGRGVM